MTTTKTPSYLEVEGDNTARTLESACEKLNSGDELTINFSRISRVDPGIVRVLDTLARAAEEKTAKVTLRGVNIEVYKVLKLARLAARFSFES